MNFENKMQIQRLWTAGQLAHGKQHVACCTPNLGVLTSISTQHAGSAASIVENIPLSQLPSCGSQFPKTIS